MSQPFTTMSVAIAMMLAGVACSSSPKTTSSRDSGAGGKAGGAASGGAGATGGGGGGEAGTGARATGGRGGAGGGAVGSGGSAGASSCRGYGQSCSATENCCLPYICAGNCYPGVSDRNLKRDIDPVEPEEILQRLSALPISKWSYKTDADGVRHIGPMAQDFKSTFGVGASDKLIMQVDADGVALAAIQALNRQVEDLRVQNAQLSTELAALRAELHPSKRRHGRQPSD